MSGRTNGKLRDQEMSELANRALAKLEKLFLKANESMSPRDMMMAYLRLRPEERNDFDRMYAQRVRLLEMATLLRQATPKQLRRAREVMNMEKQNGGKGIA